MFAGEGDAFRTNRRFKLLSTDMPAQAPVHRVRLGHALRLRPGRPRPDIYGKVGNSGVSIATLDDMKVLYGGFDLCRPTTSVSMTINGPAPTILAMFLNTAIDQQLDKFRDENGREPDDDEREELARLGARQRARHRAGRHPQGRPGPEHLHLLHRVLARGDGRHPGVLRRSTRCATSTRCRSPAITSPRPGANPISPARVHARQRLHLRREPTSRAACTSTTSRPTCRSSSPTAWTRSTR